MSLISWEMDEAESWAWRQMLPPAHKLVLLILAKGARFEEGAGWVTRISQRDLSRHSLCTERTTRAYLEEFVKKKLVEKLGIEGGRTRLDYRMVVTDQTGKLFRSEIETGKIMRKTFPVCDSRYMDARASSLNSSSSQISLIPNGGEGAAPSGAPARAVTRAKSLLPEGFEPDAKAVAMAKAMKLNPHALAAEFRDHYAANGKPMADWQASFRSWIRKEIKLKAERGGAGRFL